MNSINKTILMSVAFSVSIISYMQNDNSLDGKLRLIDGWIDLCIQKGKHVADVGSEGVDQEIYKFITKESLPECIIVYAPTLKYTPGEQQGDGKDIMTFLSCMKALRNDHRISKNIDKTVFPRLVAHRVTRFMLPDQIGETVFIKKSKLCGLKEIVNGKFENKEYSNIASVFVMKTMQNGADVKLITL